MTDMTLPIPGPRLRVGILGAGRAGRAFAAALAGIGAHVELGSARSAEQLASIWKASDLVLLCAPDDAIADVAAASVPHVREGLLVAHVAGAVSLEALAPVRDVGARTFGIHPLRVLPSEPDACSLSGAPAAIGVAGEDQPLLAFAGELARALGMEPFELDDARRDSYHAAASIAANFPIALLDGAVRLAADAGIEPDTARRMLATLAIGGLEVAASRGTAEALTGPIARGDHVTVARHRAAIAEAAPDLLEPYEAMAGATRRLAGRRVVA